MVSWHRYLGKHHSLNKQILAAEQQLVQRKQHLSCAGTRLLHHLRQRMTAPATLGLAVAMGYICAEMTECQTRIIAGKQQKTESSINSALSITQHCVTLLHEFYTALPFILLIKSYFATDRIIDPANQQQANTARCDNRQSE
jgi:hypothetical protein